jgi:hypothetical protein
MTHTNVDVLMQGMVFDFLSLAIAVLTIVQLVWHLFVRE